MKLFFYISLIFFISKSLLSYELFETNQHIIKFQSKNIIKDKQNKIIEIKINDLKKIFETILTKDNYKKIEKNIDITFTNKFILNIKIKDEKIINENYYSKIKINFNKNSIEEFLINNQFNYSDYKPKNFLLLIFEQDKIENYFLSNKNSYYKFFKSNELEYKNNFLIPNLDYNDRYILNKINYKSDLNNKIQKLNIKYKTEYTVFITSNNINNIYHIKAFLFYKNNKFLIYEKKIDKLNYKKLFFDIYNNSFDKWKQINEINTSYTNTIDCKIIINNIEELKFVTNLLNSNKIIKNLELKSIRLNENIYKITYFGKTIVFSKSLEKFRLKLMIRNNLCNVKII